MLRSFGRHVRQQFVGYLALFIALGGVSYAAITLPINSVGSKQIKREAVKNSDLGKSAVTTGKVKNGSLLSIDFKPGQLVAGAPGATGPQGPQGLKGDAGTNGTDGAPGPFPATLPSGKTLTGTYAGLDRNTGTGGFARIYAPISFPFPLASPPTVRLVVNGTTTPECQGTIADPKAAPGNVCIYRSSESSTPTTDAPDLNGRSGKTGLFLSTTGAPDAFAYGSWAVTAP